MYDRVQMFFNYLQGNEEYSANTIAAYRNDLSQFLDFLKEHGIERAADVRRDHIVEFLFLLRDRDYASSTVARKMAAVKSFFHYLQEAGEVAEDPTDNVDSPRVKKYAPKSLTLEELQRLLDEPAKDKSAKGLRDCAMLELLYATGLRVSELVNLRLADLALDEGTLHCPGPRQGERLLPISEQAKVALHDYMESGRAQLVRDENEDRLFLNMRGGQLTRQGLWLIIRAYVEQAGITSQVTPHTLRHSFAIHRLRDGATLSTVQELLGHVNISTTQVYMQGRAMPEREAGDDGLH
jgi:integrase/recombinase XerD